MIRVLQIGMNDNLGGIENFIINYYRNINKELIQFDFINIYENKLCFQDEIEKMGGVIYKVTSYYKHPIKYINELKKIILENNYKIVHCNMNSACFLYPLIASKLAGIKVIISHSHNSSSDKGLKKEILHNINKHLIPIYATYYFACSLKAGLWFYNKKIIESNRFEIIKNAIDTKKFKFNEVIRTQKRKELKIRSDQFVIGHVGRFSRQKNHEFLVKWFKHYCEINKNSILILIGIGELKNKIENDVRKLGMSNKVIFLGQRNDTADIYQIMDLFILPSLYEGLPLVGVEAQASGVPCLFSNSITKEILLNKNVKFFDLNDSYMKIDNYIDEVVKITKNRCDTNVESYDIKYNANVLTKIYEDLILEN